MSTNILKRKCIEIIVKTKDTIKKSKNESNLSEECIPSETNSVVSNKSTSEHNLSEEETKKNKENYKIENYKQKKEKDDYKIENYKQKEEKDDYLKSYGEDENGDYED